MTLKLRCLVVSRDKLKPLYLYYHNNYGHKNLHADDFPYEAFTQNVKALQSCGRAGSREKLDMLYFY